MSKALKSFAELSNDPELKALRESTTYTSKEKEHPPVHTSMKEYYTLKYGEPKNDNQAIHILQDIYRDFISGNKIVTMEQKDGIAEYYRILQERQLPAFEWIIEAFHVTSKKEAHKKNFPYVVGMLRQWMKYGFGYIPNREEEEVVDYFEEACHCGISDSTRLLIRNLMGTFGGIRVTRMIGRLDQQEVDKSFIMASLLRTILEEKYGGETDGKK